MPSDRVAIEALCQALQQAGIVVPAVPDTRENPCIVDLELASGARRSLLIYSNTLTANKGRSKTERRLQTTFGSLRFPPDADTLLLGHIVLPSGVRVFAAFDPTKHRTPGKTSSIQVQIDVLEAAAAQGIGFQHKRRTSETVVTFTVDHFVDYLDELRTYHDLSPNDLLDLRREVETEAARSTPQRLLTGSAGDRQKSTATITRWVRDHAFSGEVKKYYDRCAVCQLNLPSVIQGAHIIPVAEQGSTDTLDNALGLCPLCHKLYDDGTVLISPDKTITLSPGAATVPQLAKWVQPRLWTPMTLPSNGQPSPSKLRTRYNKQRLRAVPRAKPER